MRNLKSINQVKAEILVVIAMLVEIVRKQSRLSDDVEPFIEFNSRKVGNAAEAHYDYTENVMRFKIGTIDTETICHEIAHWVQIETIGKTQCQSTPPTSERYDSKLQVKHYRLTEAIKCTMTAAGYDREINEIMG